MSVRKLNGTQTLGGKFWWETVYRNHDWKVQHHKTNFWLVGLKPYRLLDPNDHLVASSDNEDEMKEYLDNLMRH